MRAALTRRRLLLGAASALAPLGTVRAGAAGAKGGTRIGNSVVRFADLDLARTMLAQHDDWMAATGPFQRRAVMDRHDEVTLDDFQRWNRDAARPWDVGSRLRWQTALDGVSAVLAGLRLPLPPEVWLVCTNGQESARAPYTRGLGVMLPIGLAEPGYTDEMILAHELWHVASRHAPAVATQLYAEIGFEPIAPLRFPAEWADLRLANPDAPDNAHAIRIEVAGRSPLVTPVLVASRTVLKPSESFFDVLQPRLLEVEPEPGGQASQAVTNEHGPVWHPIRTPGYLQRLGGNTSYVMHPEEVIADNVALLAGGVRPRNPELLRRLEAVLRAQG